jgi:hypothetical protein
MFTTQTQSKEAKNKHMDACKYLSPYIEGMIEENI